MSTLQSLKFTAARKPIQQPPVVVRRHKLIKKLFEQMEFAKAQRDGRHYAPTRLRRYKNSETGISQMMEVPKRVKPWWWTAADGKVCLTVFYGSRPLSFGKGKSSIEIASGDELIAALEAIKQAVEKGELDAEIEAASGALKANFKA
jgi:hypothetical protein